MQDWYVYLIKCSDSSYYCGVTTDINRRLYEHNHTKYGAKYVQARRPARLMYLSEPLSKSQAMCFEARIKKLPRNLKEKIIAENISDIASFLRSIEKI